MQLRDEWNSSLKMLPCNQNGSSQWIVFCEALLFSESSRGDHSLCFLILLSNTTFMFLVLEVLFEHTKETSTKTQVSCVQNLCSVYLWDDLSKKDESNIAFHENKRLMIAQNRKMQCCLLCMKTWQHQLMLLNERVFKNGKTRFPKNTTWSGRNSNSSVSQLWAHPPLESSKHVVHGWGILKRKSVRICLILGKSVHLSISWKLHLNLCPSCIDGQSMQLSWEHVFKG